MLWRRAIGQVAALSHEQGQPRSVACNRVLWREGAEVLWRLVMGYRMRGQSRSGAVGEGGEWCYGEQGQARSNAFQTRWSWSGAVGGGGEWCSGEHDQACLNVFQMTRRS
jgi:hypothetical protein